MRRVAAKPKRSAGVLLTCGLAVSASVLFAVLPFRPTPRIQLVLWAWERPEDLRFVADRAVVAVLAGTITLQGETAIVKPRAQPLLVAPGQTLISVVHLEIDRRMPLVWTPALRTQAVHAALAMAGNVRSDTVQIDFEVRASERDILLGTLRDVRAALPAATRLSMTALASWCDTETWLDAAPADETVPMLFRMGPEGDALKRRLANGGDLALRKCRTSIGIATDTPPDSLPAGRRLYIFDPHSWTETDFAIIQRKAEPW